MSSKGTKHIPPDILSWVRRMLQREAEDCRRCLMNLIDDLLAGDWEKYQRDQVLAEKTIAYLDGRYGLLLSLGLEVVVEGIVDEITDHYMPVLDAYEWGDFPVVLEKHGFSLSQVFNLNTPQIFAWVASLAGRCGAKRKEEES